MEPARNPRPELDALTVAAIAVVAYALSNVVHEGLGHGGACVALGGHPRQLTAVFSTVTSRGSLRRRDDGSRQEGAWQTSSSPRWRGRRSG